MTQTKKQIKSRKRTLKSQKTANQEVKVLFGLGIVAVVIIFAATLLFNRSKQAQEPLTAVDQARLIREDSPSRGPADAPVTLVEFLDPECESCRAAYPVVEKILEDYKEQIRYVVRYFPNHNNSVLAIVATEAAGEQGKYWEMQKILFTNQPQWGEQNTSQASLFIRYAGELGLNIKTFTESLQNPLYLEKANRDKEDAQDLAIRGTPTFFVNGQLVYGMDETSLRSFIDKALANG